MSRAMRAQPVEGDVARAQTWRDVTTERCEGRIDFAAGAGVEDLDLQPEHARRLLQSLVKGPAFRLSRFTSAAIVVAAGTSSCSRPNCYNSQAATESVR